MPANRAPKKSAPATGTRVKFWGMRGSIPTPVPSTVRYGGNTSCVEVRAAGEILILDAGTGLRLLGQQLASEFDGQPLDLTLMLTHTHWDHIQGLPFFAPFYGPQNHLRILGYEGARHGLDNVLASQMESPYFPIGFRHSPQIPGAEETQEVFAAREDRKLADFLRGTDMLIMDSQYDRAEYPEHVHWGHGCVDDVVNLALKAEVKRLFLFHHDPDHDDGRIDRMVESARKLVAKRNAKMKVEGAREGMTVELG